MWPIAIRTCLVLVAVSGFAHHADAQNFSCRIGTQAACLDYGDTVCSSSGMCVDRDAECFDRFQCDFQGFTCRSNLTECADDYDRLASDYNGLLRNSQNLADDYQRLGDEIATTSRCVQNAETIEEARYCVRGN